jgi:hypothetical protein
MQGKRCVQCRMTFDEDALFAQHCMSCLRKSGAVWRGAQRFVEDYWWSISRRIRFKARRGTRSGRMFLQGQVERRVMAAIVMVVAEQTSPALASIVCGAPHKQVRAKLRGLRESDRTWLWCWVHSLKSGSEQGTQSGTSTQLRRV